MIAMVARLLLAATPTLWAFGIDLPVKVLAIIGAFALGGWAVGWVFAMVCIAVFNQKVPRTPTWIIRVLGGVLCAWLIALWLFGGGSGFGGAGGWGFGGTGKGAGEKDKSDKVAKNEEKDKKSEAKDKKSEIKDIKEDPGIGLGETIRLEVLGDGPLRSIAKGGTFDASARYRFTGRPDLMTFSQAKEAIRDRRGKNPPARRLEIVLYKDSPDRDKEQVKTLTDWANDLKQDGKGGWLVEFSLPDSNAPLE